MADAAAPAVGSGGPGRDDDPAGPQLAQATPGAFGDPIGAIRDVAGQALIVHPDGASEPAAIGLPVFANDIVATGPEAAVRIVFLDGTTFSLGANGQIRLDRLIYDPDGSNNSLDATVVKGSFVFITGQIEKTEGEGITIDTPAGSIGIRGTSGAGTEDPRSGNWIFTLLRDPDGTLSRFSVFNPAGVQVLDQEFEATEVAGRQLPPSQTFILTPGQAGALFNDALRVLQQEYPHLQNPEQRGELDDIIPAAGEEDAPVEQAQAPPVPQALIDVYGLQLALALVELLAALGLDATDLDLIEVGGALVPLFVPDKPRSPLIDSDRAPNQVASNAEAGDYVGLTVEPNIPILSGPLTFSLANDAGGLFVIDPQTGQVTVTAELPPGTYTIVARATTESGVSADTAFHVTIVPDAVPLSVDDVVSTADRLGLTVNLVVAIDISGSMGGNPGVAGFASRLDLARAAIAVLFAAHGATAQLNIQIVAFAGATVASGWLTSIDEANAFLAGLAAGGGTNYAAGIAGIMDAFADAPPADKAEVYFLSDGTPTAGTSLAAAGLVDEWEAFLADPANGIAHAFAVGVGTGVQANDPDHVQVAFPNDDVSTLLVVTDPGQLADTLVSTAPNPISGNVLANDDFGDDGPAAEQITQLEHGGQVFTRDSAADGVTVLSNDGQAIVIGTDLGGTLQFNFDTGDFTYTPPDVTGPQLEQFGYTIADSDGSTAQAVLQIAVTDAAAPVLLAADLLRAADVVDDGSDDILADGAPNPAPAPPFVLPFLDAAANLQLVLPVD